MTFLLYIGEPRIGLRTLITTYLPRKARTYITETVSQVTSGWVRRVHDKWPSEHIHALSGCGLSAHAADDRLG